MLIEESPTDCLPHTRGLAESAVPWVLIDASGHIREANRAFLAATGLVASADAIGMRLGTFVVEAEDNSVPDATTRPVGLRSLSGSIVRCLAVPVAGGSGDRSTATVFIGLDEVPAPDDSRFRGLFEDAPVALWEQDYSKTLEFMESLAAKGVGDVIEHLADSPRDLERAISLIRVRDLNRAAMEMIHAPSRDSVIGSLPAASLTPDARNAFIHQLKALWEGSAAMSVECRGATMTGAPIDVLLFWVAADGDQGIDPTRVVLGMIDVSVRRNQERLTAELVHSKEYLLASVAHEVRGPLARIRDLADDVVRTAPDPLAAELIQEAATSLLDRVDVIAATIGGPLLKPVTIATVDVAAEAIRVRNAYPGDRAALIRVIGSRMFLSTDPGRLRLALTALLDAALAAKPRSVVVRVTEGATKGGVVIVVADDGRTDGRMLSALNRHRPESLLGDPAGIALARACVDAVGGTLVPRRMSGHTEWVMTLPPGVRNPESTAQPPDGR